MTDEINNITQFRAAAAYCEDVTKHEAPEVSDQYTPDMYADDLVPAAWVYPGYLVILDFKEDEDNNERYCLVLGNREWLANDLAALEEKLYDYYRIDLEGR